MRFNILIAVASITASASVQAQAQAPAFFVATNPERASGFKDLADCQRNIAATPQRNARVRKGRHYAGQGSVFNRTHGNITRCEMIEGEALVVVYPRLRGS